MNNTLTIRKSSMNTNVLFVSMLVYVVVTLSVVGISSFIQSHAASSAFQEQIVTNK